MQKDVRPRIFPSSSNSIRIVSHSRSNIMDFYRPNYEIIVWVDSFLFFYWDIQRYRPADAETVDRLIIDYFQRQTPSITSGENPSPWNALLCNLMRSLACLLGIVAKLR